MRLQQFGYIFRLTSNSSSLAICTTPAVTSSTKVLNLQFVKNAESAKFDKAKCSKTQVCLYSFDYHLPTPTIFKPHENINSCLFSLLWYLQFLEQYLTHSRCSKMTSYRIIVAGNFWCQRITDFCKILENKMNLKYLREAFARSAEDQEVSCCYRDCLQVSRVKKDV